MSWRPSVRSLVPRWPPRQGMSTYGTNPRDGSETDTRALPACSPAPYTTSSTLSAGLYRRSVRTVHISSNNAARVVSPPGTQAALDHAQDSQRPQPWVAAHLESVAVCPVSGGPNEDLAAQYGRKGLCVYATCASQRCGVMSNTVVILNFRDLGVRRYPPNCWIFFPPLRIFDALAPFPATFAANIRRT